MSDPVLRLDGFVPYRLSFTTSLVSGYIATAYESLFGLTIPEWRLIAIIAEEGEVTQQAICARSRMDKVTVSRAAIALAARGLIARVPNAADRRSHLLMLTDTGRSLHAQVAPKAIELERRLFAGFGRDEIDRLTDMLRRIDAAALALLDGPPED